MKTISAIAMFICLGIAAGLAQEVSDIEHLKTLANAGDYKSAHQLALAYAVGDGVAKDRKASDHWYTVAASLRDRRTPEEAAQARVGMDRPLLTNTNASSDGQVYSGGSGVESKPTTQQPTSDVPAWKKAFNAVVAAPAKTKAFLSDHSDDLTEVASFVFEEYFTGSEPSEGTVSKAEASDAGRTLRQYREQQQGK